MAELLSSGALVTFAFWAGYLVGCGMRLAIGLDAHREIERRALAEQERWRRYESAAPWAKELVARIEREAGEARSIHANTTGGPTP